MIRKNYLGKIVVLGTVGIAFLIQPALAYVSEFGFPAVGIIALETSPSTLRVADHQKNNNDVVYQDNPSQVSPPDGAEFMVSSVPVVIHQQGNKNIFTVNIPNDKGGYSTVFLQKFSNRFIGLPGECYPDFPVASQ